MSNRVRRPMMAVLGFLVAASLVALPAAGAIELPRPLSEPLSNPDFDHPAENPDLEKSCGLNILVILDGSSSIEISDATGDVRTALKAFTGALNNTASSMAVSDFGTVATLPRIGPFAPGQYITITDSSKPFLDDYIDNDYDPPHGPPYQYTAAKTRYAWVTPTSPRFPIPRFRI